MHARRTAKANQEGSQARQAQYAVDQEGGSVSFPVSSKVRLVRHAEPAPVRRVNERMSKPGKILRKVD